LQNTFKNSIADAFFMHLGAWDQGRGGRGEAVGPGGGGRLLL